ncbi:hypothetical protein M3Y96_00569500 [Aphelenchoides besseyi]|nr:hypothetical protein M3Y96_00569500 [Aphelenchoides besseyi]
MQTNVDAQPEDVEIVKPLIHSIQNNIQTLRAIAIWFVLLFHMWPTRIKQGYLGVDIFFVISGYLMCLILSRKCPINLSVCVEFYYRRVKRIVPLYFTVILIVLVALRHVISPIEFTQLYEEAIPALGFYSNIPNMREAAYFDISSNFYYFLHSWSLSVELQFYLIVPLIFVFLDRIEELHVSLRSVLIAVIPTASFIFQCYASKDFAHMLLPARIWQFFVGFGAFYLREQRFFDLSKENANKWIDSVKIVVVHMLLVLLLVFSLPIVSQLQRLFVVLLTGAVVGSHCETSVLSNLRPVITLGDISYSVYLIHWPLFTWHRYAHSEIYTDGGESSLITGLQLIAISIGVGYVVENAFKWLMKRVSGWRALTLLLCILLCLNGMQLHDLRDSAVDLDAGLKSNKATVDWKQQLRRDIETLWLTREKSAKLTNDQISSYNSKQFQAFHGEFYCDDLNHTIPTTYPLNMISYHQKTHTCHAKGNGTKNIVLIGNSHALHNFPGISFIFRHTYKQLTLFSRDNCLPTIRKFQASDPSTPHTDECMELINATVPALQAWKQPIDIVIAFYAMAGDRPLETTFEKDEYYTTMQKFYTELGEIPREVLIIMESFPIFPNVPIREVESRMKTGKPLNTIGNEPQLLRQRTPGIIRRMEHIECPKCLKLDLISFWCNRTHDNFCHSTDPQGIILFVGSFYNADFIYWLYRKFVV